VLVTNTTNGCTNTAAVNVADAKVIPLLTLVPQDNTICDPAKATLGTGSFDGQVLASVNNISGGSTVNDYFFDWNVGTDGNGTVLLAGLDVGLYSVTALHNITGCKSSSYSAQVLSAKQLPTIDVQQLPSQNCAGGAADGTAFVNSVLPAGKTYDYKWYDGTTAIGAVKDTDDTYANVQGGLSGVSLLSYTVAITILQTGCSNTATVGVSDDSQLPILGALTHVDNTLCVGVNGSAAISTLSYRGTGQPIPYTGFTINWSNTDTGPSTSTPLAAGTYSVTVTNTNDNCTSNPVSVTVKDDLFIPVINIADIDQSSCDPLNPTGELAATIDETIIGGGASITAGYSFLWVDNVTTNPVSNTNGLIQNLKGNQTYTVTVLRSLTQCSNTKTAYLNETLTPPVVTVTPTNMTTCMPLNGELVANVTPLLGNYTYYWYNGSGASNEAFVIANANFTVANNNQYSNLAPGSYTVVVQDNVTKCNASQVVGTLSDASPAINITVTNVALPTTCGATNSEMDATANGVTAGYSFDWYAGVPSNSGVPNYFTNPPVFNPPGSLGSGDKLFGQVDGLYTVQVTDLSTGCKNFLPNTLPFQNAHAVIKIVKKNSTICPYTTGNGSIEIEIFNPVAPPPPVGTNETSYVVSLLQGATTIVAPFNPTVPVGSFVVSNTLAPGSYTLAVQEKYSASQCFVYQDVLIGADALPPVITLASSIVSNSACGASSYDGQISIHVDQDPDDLTVGTTYDIDMSPDPNSAFPLLTQSPGNYAATSLGPNDYVFTALASTGCSSSKTFTVLDQPAVAEMVSGNVSVFSSEYCDVSKEQSAKIIVNQIGIINGAADVLNNYRFDWYNNASLATPIYSQTGDPTAVKGGEELSNIAPLPTSIVTAGSYWVIASKIADAGNLGGLGCTSAPFKVDIADHSVKPLITLKPFSNTSCDGNFEGKLQVDIITPSVYGAPDLSPGNGATYRYDWGAVATPIATPAVGQTGVANLFSSLKEGSYTLISTNEITGCASTLSTTILRDTPPVFTLNTAVTNQDNCGPFNGLINGIKVFVDGAAGNVNDFNYVWYRNDLLTKVLDGKVVGSPLDQVLDITTYPAIGLDAYYIKSVRIAGTGPGSGCESVAIREDILDDRVYPTIKLTSVSSTACDNNFDGQITVTASTASGPGSGSNYDITWTNDPDGLAGPLYSASNAVNQASPYSTLSTDLIGDGSYAVQVTNVTTSCSATGSIVLQKITVPQEIVSVTATAVDVCLPQAVNGSGTVTDVKIGMSAGQSALFTYTWDDDALIGSPFVVDNAALTQGGLDIGTYYVRAKRNAVTSPGTPGITGSGCTTAPVRFDVLNARQYPNATFNSIPNSVCPGAPVGNGTITASSFENDGSVSTYSYIWVVNGTTLAPTTSTLNNATDGLYNITVVNTVNDCRSTFDYTLILDQSLSTPNIVTVLPVNPTDCNPTGSAAVTSITIGNIASYTNPPDDLDTPFDYEWFASAYPLGLLGGEVNHQLLNQKPGTYYVLVKDLTTNCISTPVDVKIDDLNIIYPDVSLIQTKKQISCLVTGSAELLATVKSDNPINPNPTYKFEWFNNLDFTPPIQQTTNTTAKLDLRTSITAGLYSVAVTNTTTGCTDSAIYVVPNEVPLYSPELTMTIESMTNCINPDGAVFVRNIADYGILDDPADPTDIPDYPFSSFNFVSEYYVGVNPDTSVPGLPMTPVPFASKPSWGQSGLTNDILYTVKVTDSNTGCSTIIDGTISDGRVYPVIEITVDNPLINCDLSRPNGQLSATADGLVGGYTFQWYPGLTTTGSQLPSSDNKLVGVGFTESPTLEFTVRATNNVSGCPSEKSGMLTDGRVNPPLPNATVIRDRTSCLIPNGWAAADVGGTIFNYTFDWYDGSTVQGAPDFTGSDYIGLDTLFYTVTATDQVTGCISGGKTIKVKDLRKFPKLKLFSEPSYCAGTNKKATGSVLITVENSSDVTLDQINWYDENTNANVGTGSQVFELYPGHYRADVVSSEGCTGSDTVTVVTEILAYNLVSANNDGKNDGWIIDCIDEFPNNNVKIYDREGILVYEARGYDNAETMFKGIGERGIYPTGRVLPDGTYFYIIDKRNGSKPIVGYLELVR
jgi:hypothetical protein